MSKSNSSIKKNKLNKLKTSIYFDNFLFDCKLSEFGKLKFFIDQAHSGYINNLLERE